MKPEELIGKTVEILNMYGAMSNSNSFPFNIGAKLKIKNAEEDNPGLCLWFEGMPTKWHTTYDCIRICEDDYNTIVQEVLKRYPAGTIVNSLYRSRPHLTVNGIIGEFPEQEWAEKKIWMNTDGIYRALVYSDGEWAEIVSSPSVSSEPFSVSSEPLQKTKKENLRGQALLDEANRRYPPGTKYKALTYNGSEGTTKTSVRNARFVVDCDDNYVDVGADYVYINGMWADVVQPVDSNKSVRSGDWVHITKSCGGYAEPGNFCKVSELSVRSERSYCISGQWYRNNGTPLLKLSQNVGLEAFEKVDTPSWYKGETNESKPSSNTNPPKGNIVDEISKRYPIGTQYIPLSMAGEEMDTPFTVLMNNVSVGGGEGFGWAARGSDSGFVYHGGTGKWARIVKEAAAEEKPSALTACSNTCSNQNPTLPTTEQLKTLYPIGTKYYYVAHNNVKGRLQEAIGELRVINIMNNKLYADYRTNMGYVYCGGRYAIILINGEEFDPNDYASADQAIAALTRMKHIASESPLFPDQYLNKESELKIISKDKTLDTSVPEEVKLNGDVQEESQQFYF